MARSDDSWRNCASWLTQCEVLRKDHKANWSAAVVLDLANTLRDGVLLCSLLNVLDPGCIDMKDVSQKPQMAQFLCLRNIKVFLHTCHVVFGLKETDLFEPSILYELTDFYKVLNTLSKLSNCPKVQRRGIPYIPGFSIHKTRTASEEDIYKDLNAADDIARHIHDEEVEYCSYYALANENDVYEDLCSITHRVVTEAPPTTTHSYEKRDYVIKELVETEKNYVEVLATLQKSFMRPLSNMLKGEDIKIIFGRIKELSEIHSGFYSHLLKAVAPGSMVKLSDVFINWREKFLLYGEYCANLTRAQEHVQEICAKNEILHQIVIRCELETNQGKFKLQDILSVPMQRILKYPLILEKLIKETHQTHEDYRGLERAKEAIVDAAQFINEVKRDSDTLEIMKKIQDSISDLKMPENTELKDYGSLVKDGELKIKAHDDQKIKLRSPDTLQNLASEFDGVSPFEITTPIRTYTRKIKCVNHSKVDADITSRRETLAECSQDMCDTHSESSTMNTDTVRTYSKLNATVQRLPRMLIPLEDIIDEELSEDQFPALIIEPDTRGRERNVIEGRRIVDLNYFMKEYNRLALHPLHCTGGEYVYVSECRQGLVSILTFYCNVCGRTEKISTESPDSRATVNTAFVWGAFSIGIGQSQAEEFFSLLEIPVLTDKHFRRHGKIVEQIWKEKLTTKMYMAIEEEKRLAIENGDVDEGHPFITVIVDGAWSKRSYGHGFSSNSGVGETYSYRESIRLHEYKVEDVSNRRTLRGDARWNYHFFLVSKSEKTAYTLYTRTEELKYKWIEAIQSALDNIEPSGLRKTDHKFHMHTFDRPTICHHCSKFLKGLIFQGYRCHRCDIAVHKQCIEYSGRCGAPPLPPPRPPRQDPPPYACPDPSLRDHLWFVGEMGRDTATTMLERHVDGTYLLRIRPQGATHPNETVYALSLKAEGKVKHMKVHEKVIEGVTHYYLSEARFFRSIIDMIVTYEHSSLSENFVGLNEVLKWPYRRIVAIADFDFNPLESNQLTLRKGCQVVIVSKEGDDKGWWKGRIHDKVGFFPKVYVHVVQEAD